MEGRMPKPSGLKRPTPVTKNILPMDRIKAANLGGAPTNIQLSGLNFLPTPLTRDPTNVTAGIKRTERAASPELLGVSNQPITRPKMRRSRSATDLRHMRPLKRLEPTLAPIPAKFSRFNPNTTTNALSNSSTAATTSSKREFPMRPATRVVVTRPGSTTTTTNTTGTKRAIVRVSSATTTRTTVSTVVKRAGNTAANNACGTSVSTTGANKPINKRIPPYDFKARYHDLLEKHNALKEKYEKMREQMGSLEGMPEQLEETQATLSNTEAELSNTKSELECLQRQFREQESKLATLMNSLDQTKQDLESLQADHLKISAEKNLLDVEVVELRERSSLYVEENEALNKELSICREQLFRSNIERKELHNTVMDLKGNIRVFCRVRPPLDTEQNKQLCGWKYPDDTSVEIQNLEAVGRNKQSAHAFNFDNVFHPGCRQEDVFEMVAPLIQSALDGYNVCIFAYGQTGSGKTYTMDGIPTNPGVIPRTVDLLFDAIKNYKRLGWEYDIKVTFLEIYNEVLYDLLSNEQKDMDIRMASHNKNDIYVSNITEETVANADHLRQLMEVATMNRATAATVGNERSSRSHAVTKIELYGTHSGKQETLIGRINLVDLAGSESPKTSLRMNETKNINRSLSELTNVILALMAKQDHIPYRNSKLTHLLMPSLGGNSKTLMFINVAPFQDCYIESLNSLRFAASVNSCKVSKAKRNRILNTSNNTTT